MTTAANAKYLVVWVHPVPDSFSAALRDAVVAALPQPPEVIDLYNSGFDAHYMTASATDPSSSPSADHSVNPNAEILTQHRSQIAAAEALLFVYPTWWDGLPASFKSWLEQLFPDALDTRSGQQAAQQTLANIKLVAVATTHGSSKWVNAVQGQAGRKTLSQSLKGLCHRKCRFKWVSLYRIDVSTSRQRQDFLARAAHKIAKAASRYT